MSFYVLVQGGYSVYGRSISCSQGDRGGSECPRAGCFPSSSIQKNQYTIVAQLGAVSSGSPNMIHFPAAGHFCVKRVPWVGGGRIMRLFFLSISALNRVLGMALWPCSFYFLVPSGC